MTALLDTNVIIRELTQDAPLLSARAHALLERVEAGARDVLLTEGVLVECVQVLSSEVLYNRPRAEIARSLATVIRLRGTRLANKRRYLRALTVYANFPALDFVDALLVAYAEFQKSPTVISFDCDFDRVAGLVREEP